MALDLVDDNKVAMETREVPPSHFLFRIESFSLLEKSGIEKYESTEFVADDYKWKLVIYPNGHNTGTKGNHISVYLAMADTTSLAANWEFNAIFSIFLLNQIRGNFIVTQGRARRFLAVKSEWGFSKFISKKVLKDRSKGYLVDDSCVFGAEVFVIKSSPVIEHLHNVINPFKHSWKICKFSKLEDVWTSENFTAQHHKWNIKLYPKGYASGLGRSVSIFLYHAPSDTSARNQKAIADYSICIRNQMNDKHRRCKAIFHWFSSSSTGWGWPDFLPLADMNDPDKGYIVNDSCIVEIEISEQAIKES